MSLIQRGDYCTCEYSHNGCDAMTYHRGFRIYQNLLEAMVKNEVTDKILKTDADKWCNSRCLQFNLKSIKTFLRDD